MNSHPLIRILPSELLGKIFHLGATCRESSNPPFPILISGVCKLWRSIVISTPDVWTQISLNLTSSYCVPLARIWLERSKACLLDVQLSYGSGAAFNWAEATRCMSHLCQESHRWKTLRMLGMLDTLVLQSISQVALLHLESVDIQRLNNHKPTSLYALFASQTIPLKDLQLVATMCPWRVYGLHSLSLSLMLNVSFTDLIELLISSPSLVRLELASVEFRADPSPNEPVHVELQHLKSLSFSFSSISTTYGFRYISFPNLGELELSGHPMPPSFAQFFGHQDQWTKLHTLRLRGIYTRLDQFDAPFLRSLDGIQDLELSDTPLELLLQERAQPLTRPRTLSIGTGFRHLRQPGPSRMGEEFPPTTRNTFVVPRLSIKEDIWPKLKRVSVDSISQSDARWLFSLVASRSRLEIRLSQRFRRQISAHATEPYGIEWLHEHCVAVVDL